MNGLIVAALAVIGSTLTGRSVLMLFDRVCGTREVPRDAAEIWGISTLLGVTFSSAGSFVWSDMGRLIGAEFSWRQVLIGGLLGMIAASRSRHAVSLRPAVAFTHPSRLCQAIIGVTLLMLFAHTVRQPLAGGVERDQLERKARILFESQTIDAPPLVQPQNVSADTREPLMLPLFERHVAALRGKPDPRWARVWSPLTFAGMVLSFAGVVARRSTLTWGWVIATGLALLPILITGESGVASARSDVPTACFHGAAILYLWDALQEPPGRSQVRAILLAAGLASSACFVRNEGLGLLMVDCLAWATAVLLHGAMRKRPAGSQDSDSFQVAARFLFGLAMFIAFAVFLLTPWMRYRSSLPWTPEMSAWSGWATEPMWANVRKLPSAAASWLHVMRGDIGMWALPLWMTLLAMLTAPRRNAERPALFVLVSMMGALVFVVSGENVPAMEHQSAPLQSLILVAPVAVLCLAAVWCPRGGDFGAADSIASPPIEAARS